MCDIMCATVCVTVVCTVCSWLLYVYIFVLCCVVVKRVSVQCQCKSNAPHSSFPSPPPHVLPPLFPPSSPSPPHPRQLCDDRPLHCRPRLPPPHTRTPQSRPSRRHRLYMDPFLFRFRMSLTDDRHIHRCRTHTPQGKQPINTHKQPINTINDPVYTSNTSLNNLLNNTPHMYLKALASSVSHISFNLLGHFLSPALSGWMMGVFATYVNRLFKGVNRLFGG